MSIFQDDGTGMITADNMTVGTVDSHLVQIKGDDGGHYLVPQKEA
jgi:hypothetical protein